MKWNKKSKIIVSVGSALCLIAILLVVWKISASFNDISFNPDSAILVEDPKQKQDDETPQQVKDDSDLIPAPQPPEPTDDFYALMIGLDYRTGSYTLNTDSIIVAHVIPQDQKVKMVSLPRDLRMDLQSGETRKINGLFYDGYSHAQRSGNKNPDLLSGKKITLGGWTVPEEYFSSGMVHLRDKVEDLLEIEIKHSFLIHFESLITLVDAVGGIDINVQRSMHYDDPTDNTHIHFEPGWQKLDGKKALDYARFRQDNRGVDFYSNDFERAQRQQEIIAALFDSLSSWKSITRVFNILDVVSNSFKTDMKNSQMLSFIQKYYDDFSGDSIETIPFEGYWEYPYVRISEDKLTELRETLSSTSRSESAVSMSESFKN